MADPKLKNDPAGMADAWPSLPLEAWQATKDTLHMWTQVVGKIRLAQTPLVNHWWNVPLYVTPRGLTTSAMPYEDRTFEIDFDFIDHRLQINCSDGSTTALALVPRSVAAFYREVVEALARLGIEVKIWTMPVEVENPVRFEEDEAHASYDAEYANRFWRILVQADKIFTDFRARFIGKVSPVHFFWGSFDLAVTRFSGRRAPEREGADAITREAYSHEAISHGFWPGGGPVTGAAFYSYTAPEPPGLKETPVRPASAFYSKELSEFLFMYEDVRKAARPATALLEFMQSTYEAGANLAKWDRAALERTVTSEEG
ncbi:MAG TPA: DUF5996 family protein [Pyrinomonadaceae bacterium]|jgi:hypothetical protein|nr:DUF5996 family protein [Pyrinomonadaceae bacterium]